MRGARESAVRFGMPDGRALSGILSAPPAARACYVLAHGAGAGLRHAFLAAVASGLAERGIATFRYNFPYMEEGRARPDPPPVATAAVRAAMAEAAQLRPDLRLFAGGKSFGGRMTSEAEAAGHMGRVRGLAFLGFPLHPPGRPATGRAEHLHRVHIPMLFLQGTRDEFARIDLIEAIAAGLGNRAGLVLFDGADHSFKMPARSSITTAQTLQRVLDTLAGWMVSQLD